MQMKTIWFDIGHTAQLNFYMSTMRSLCKNYAIIVTVLGRGKLPKIAEKEMKDLPNVKLLVLGKHKGTKISAIIDANILRIIFIFLFLTRTKIHFHLSNGFQGSLFSKIFGFSTLTFGDDPHGLGYKLKNLFANKVYYCLYSKKFINYKLYNKTIVLPCVKEWAYLNPKYFLPKIKELSRYHLEPRQYIFIREVSTGTTNYAGQQSNLITQLIKVLPSEYKVLFSLEDKSKRNLYPGSWILLQEPVEDIHSLIFYSRALISSGDSMAREAAVMGVPSFYVGQREMAANEVLKNLVDFYQVDVDDFAQLFLDCIDRDTDAVQMGNISKLCNSFININEFMIDSTEKQLEKQ